MRRSGCDMCGKSPEQAKKLILGVKGGLCLDCVARCKAIFDNAELATTSTEGDVISSIHSNISHIGHFHTAGVPGRHELDENQELYYPAIMRAIKDTSYDGYVGQEFVPKGDWKAGLQQAYDACNV